MWELPAERITRKGKLGPGEMMAIDLKRGDLLDSDAIDRINRARAPYKQWLQQGVTYLQTELIDPSLVEEPFSEQTLRSYHKLFQLSTEEVEQILRPLAETEQEATGSMGDDTPMAVLSRQTRPLYDYFRQAFAQVTNPADRPAARRHRNVAHHPARQGDQHLPRRCGDGEPRHPQLAGAQPT